MKFETYRHYIAIFFIIFGLVTLIFYMGTTYGEKRANLEWGKVVDSIEPCNVPKYDVDIFTPQEAKNESARN